MNEVKLPDIGSVNKIHGKWDDPDVFFAFSSFSDPGTYFHLNMKDYKLQKLRSTILSDKNYKPDDFKTDQVFFTSKDGTRVPMFLVRKKSLLPTIASKP